MRRRNNSLTITAPLILAAVTVVALTLAAVHAGTGHGLGRALGRAVTSVDAPINAADPAEYAMSPASPMRTPDLSSVPFVLPTVTPTPRFRTGVRRATLAGLRHEWQTWNNCGPATTAMALSYFGIDQNQSDVATFLRPNYEDKNVSPVELADYVRSNGLQAIVRVDGDADVLRRLVSNGIPVIVEVWLEPEPGNGFGHYRLVTGYDNDAQVWTAYDSYVSDGLVNAGGAYEGITVPYSQMEQQWRVFNRTYVVAYRSDEDDAIAFAIGEALDDGVMWAQALSRAEAETSAAPLDAFGWFNQGTALVGLQRHEEAVAAYDQSFELGLPWRMLWYQFGPLEAYEATGRYAELVGRADATLATTSNVEELHYWRGVGLAMGGDAAGARAAFSAALALRPDYAAPAAALSGLQ